MDLFTAAAAVAAGIALFAIVAEWLHRRRLAARLEVLIARVEEIEKSLSELARAHTSVILDIRRIRDRESSPVPPDSQTTT